MILTTARLFVCASVIFHSFAIPVSYAVHEAREPDSVAARWVDKGRVHSDALLPVRIGLTQSNLDKGDALLMQVSDPESPQYGKHWTSKEVVEYFRPSETTITAVTTWLRANGITKTTLSGNKAWLAFDLEASKLEALLHAEYHVYEDDYTKAVIPSCHRYHLPRSLQEHVDFITPGLKMLAPNAPVKQAVTTHHARALTDSAKPGPCQFYPLPPRCTRGLKHCDEVLNPDCLKALYQFTNSNITSPNPRNALGLYEGEAQRWDQHDLNIFFASVTHGRIPNNTSPISMSIDGGVSKANTTHLIFNYRFEVLLDLGDVYPIIYPQNVAIWDENDQHVQTTSVGKETYLWGYNQLLDSIDGSYCTYSAYGETGDDPALDPKYPDVRPHGGFNGSLECGVFQPPYVLSVSYAGQENQVPMAYQARQCNEFMKLGLQGTSFLYASGDLGAGGTPASEKCCGDTVNGCLGKKKKAFNPTWPSTCPYITSVGATTIEPGSNVHEPESAVFEPYPGRSKDFAYTSGGGFSNLYARPSYQKAAVEHYLTKHKPDHPSYGGLATIKPNPAMVDVKALLGDSDGVYNNMGRAYPDVSANGNGGLYVARNETLPGGGTSQSTPVFASLVNRIVEERLAAGKTSLGFLNPALYSKPSMLNDITKGNNYACGKPAFQTAPGWDPITGLGTPNYPKMLEYFMSLP